MKNKEIHTLRANELITLFLLIIVTISSYGSFSRHIFASEKISVDQVKAEILAYQAAQIFLLKNVQRKPVQSRSLASESASFEGLIGEDSRGKPFKFSIIQSADHHFNVLLSKENEQLNAPPEAIFDLKIDLSNSPET